MITPWTIYWIGILDSVKDTMVSALAIGTIAFVLWLIALFIVYADDAEEKTKATTKKMTIIIGSIIVALLTIKPFIPSTKHAAAMYIVPAIANNENVQAIGSNGLEGLRILTEEWLQGLTETDEKTQEKSL